MLNDCFANDKDRLLHKEAIELLKTRLSTIAETETIPLQDAGGRILAQDIVAPRNIPAFDNTAVDGYAFAFDDHQPAGGFLPVAARIAAGDNQPVELPPTSAARIFTGAVMPTGADTVAMQEDCEAHEQDGAKFVIIPQGLKKGANVRLAGEDVKKDQVIMQPGAIIRPQDSAAIASCGMAEIKVYRPLKIALASTGSEIVRPGEKRLEAGVYDANYFMIDQLLKPMAVEVTDLGILADERQLIEDILTKAAKTHDIVITSGGASMGSEDHITNMLADKGNRHMWQLAIKPGRPLCFGSLDDTIFFGLPGNPVASFVCFLLYIRPSIIRLGGGDWVEPRRYKIPANFTLKNKKPDRREFWRGFLVEDEDANTRVAKYDRDGSGLISGLRMSQGFIEIDEQTTEVKEGDMLDYIPYSQFGI